MADPTMEAAVSNLDLGPTEAGVASGSHEEGGTMRIGRRCYIGKAPQLLSICRSVPEIMFRL